MAPEPMIIPLAGRALASGATARLFSRTTTRFPAALCAVLSAGTLAVARRRLGSAEFLAWALERVTIRAQQQALQRFAVIVLGKIGAERLLAHEDIVILVSVLRFFHVTEKSFNSLRLACGTELLSVGSLGSLGCLAMLDHRQQCVEHLSIVHHEHMSISSPRSVRTLAAGVCTNRVDQAGSVPSPGPR